MTLSDKVAALSAPDRAMDAEIAKVFGLEHGRKGWFANTENGDYYTTDECAGKYTSSIDAALTLIPDGYTFGMGSARSDTDAWAWVAQPNVAQWWTKAATPALAVCAAALKARGL